MGSQLENIFSAMETIKYSLEVLKELVSYSIEHTDRLENACRQDQSSLIMNLSIVEQQVFEPMAQMNSRIGEIGDRIDKFEKQMERMEETTKDCKSALEKLQGNSKPRTNVGDALRRMSKTLEKQQLRLNQAEKDSAERMEKLSQISLKIKSELVTTNGRTEEMIAGLKTMKSGLGTLKGEFGTNGRIEEMLTDVRAIKTSAFWTDFQSEGMAAELNAIKSEFGTNGRIEEIVSNYSVSVVDSILKGQCKASAVADNSTFFTFDFVVRSIPPWLMKKKAIQSSDIFHTKRDWPHVKYSVEFTPEGTMTFRVGFSRCRMDVCEGQSTSCVKVKVWAVSENRDMQDVEIGEEEWQIPVTKDYTWRTLKEDVNTSKVKHFVTSSGEIQFRSEVWIK